MWVAFLSGREILLSQIGPSEHCVPRFDTDTYCYAYDRVQREGVGIPRNCGRECIEQAINCGPRRTCKSHRVNG